MTETPIAPSPSRFTPADEACLTDRIAEVLCARRADGIPVTADELERVAIAAVGCPVNATELVWLREQVDVVLGLAGLGCYG